MKKHNFSAGPCILPQEVLEEASQSVINFNNDKLSLLEISHRSTPFVEVMEKSINLVKELLSIPEEYAVLFLQGGASLQFLMTPYNLMKKGGRAGYCNTGTWSKKAIAEAKNFGETIILADNLELLPKVTVYEDAKKNAFVETGPITSFKKLTPKLIPFL